jgi:hypothetical protein
MIMSRWSLLSWVSSLGWSGDNCRDLSVGRIAHFEELVRNITY